MTELALFGTDLFEVSRDAMNTMQPQLCGPERAR